MRSLLIAVSLCLLTPPVLAQGQPRPHNVVLFVADGLRPGMVNDRTAPAMSQLMAKGVRFSNTHSLFPTFTTANASGMATGHQLGDTGDFSNTIYVGFPVNSAAGSVTPFIENDAVLGEIDEHFAGNYLNEETVLKAARNAGLSTAIVGKVHGGRWVLHKGYQAARLFLSACSLGLAQASLDHSITYAKTRQAFGGSIGKLLDQRSSGLIVEAVVVFVRVRREPLFRVAVRQQDRLHLAVRRQARIKGMVRGIADKRRIVRTQRKKRSVSYHQRRVEPLVHATLSAELTVEILRSVEWVVRVRHITCQECRILLGVLPTPRLHILGQLLAVQTNRPRQQPSRIDL